jgi:hypothetical protein
LNKILYFLVKNASQNITKDGGVLALLTPIDAFGCDFEAVGNWVKMLLQVYLLDVLADLLRNTMLNIMINGQAVSIFQVRKHMINPSIMKCLQCC